MPAKWTGPDLPPRGRSQPQEHYVTVPKELLEVMGQLFQIKGGMYQSEERRAVVLVLQAMGIDPITGTIVVGVSIRDLDP